MNATRQRIVLSFIVIVVTALGQAGCVAPGRHTVGGSALGGLTGAAMGAIAGSAEGKSLEGAAIGAVAGGAAGGLLGNQIDRTEAEDAAISQAAYQADVSAAVSLQDIVNMTASGLTDSVIIEQVRNNGIRQSLQVNDLVLLKQQGVSDAVINAMQQARVAGTPRGFGERSSPVVVRERWVESPPPVVYVPWHGPPWRRCPPPGVHWHFEF